MDIQSLSPSLAQKLANSADATKQVVEKLLALETRSGTLLQALVTEVVSLNTREQQTLLQHLKQELTRQLGNQQTSADKSFPGKPVPDKPVHDKTNPVNPGQAGTSDLTKLVASLQVRLALVESALQTKALLQMVSLKLGLQQINTLSDLPLRVGDTLNLRVRPDGQLDLLMQRKTNTDNQAAPSRDLRTDLKQIADSLRQHLPRSAEKVQSIQTLERFIQTISQLDAQTGKMILPGATQKLLTQLIANTLKPEEFNLKNNTRLETNSVLPTVKQAIANSGGVLENSLRKLLPINNPTRQADATNLPADKRADTVLAVNPARAQSTHTAQNTAPNQIQSAIKRIGGVISSTHSSSQIKPFAPVAEGSQTSPSTRSQSPGANDAREIEQDNKAILLKLLDQLNTSNTNINAQQRLQRALQDPFIAVLRSLGLKPNSEASPRNLQREVVGELKQLVASTLARIQTLQLRSLNQGLTDRAALMPAVELSIRVNDNIYPLIIYFQEKQLKEKYDDDEDRKKDKRKRKLTQQWKVFMQFEMDDCGWFASEVALLDEKVSTRFWAESNATKTLMRSRLEGLKQKMQASGLNVEEIELLAGEPPVPNTSIQQNLVDIQT